MSPQSRSKKIEISRAEDVKWLKVFLKKFKMKVYFKNKLGVISTVELEKKNTIESL